MAEASSSCGDYELGGRGSILDRASDLVDLVGDKHPVNGEPLGGKKTLERSTGEVLAHTRRHTVADGDDDRLCDH